MYTYTCTHTCLFCVFIFSKPQTYIWTYIYLHVTPTKSFIHTGYLLIAATDLPVHLIRTNIYNWYYNTMISDKISFFASWNSDFCSRAEMIIIVYVLDGQVESSKRVHYSNPSINVVAKCICIYIDVCMYQCINP